MYVCIYKNTHIHICLEFSVKKIHPASTPIKLIKKKKKLYPFRIILGKHAITMEFFKHIL